MRTAQTKLLILCCVLVGSVAAAATLKDKEPTILYPAGHYLEGMPRILGADIYGYNYQAHKFNGSFANAYLGGAGYPPYWGDTDAYYQLLVDEGLATDLADAEDQLSALWYWGSRDVDLGMKWNDAWLSNQDRADDAGNPVPDGRLDRHYGYPSYTGSGAWLTNHRAGTYETEHQGRSVEAHWTYFIKIITPPSDAYVENGFWYTAEGVEIGEVRYGSFAAVQVIGNDPFGEAHGKLYGSPAGPGFGVYGPE
jgi:hypothetical protein